MSARLLASLLLGLSEGVSSVSNNFNNTSEKVELLSSINQQLSLAERILDGLKSSLPSEKFLAYHERISSLRSLIKEKEKKILSSV